MQFIGNSFSRLFWPAKISFFLGILFTLFGVLIFAFPKILALLVAAAFVALGTQFLFIGWNAEQFYRLRKQAHSGLDDFL